MSNVQLGWGYVVVELGFWQLQSPIQLSVDPFPPPLTCLWFFKADLHVTDSTCEPCSDCNGEHSKCEATSGCTFDANNHICKVGK